MRLLLILLTAMSFTVKDKNTVTMDGLWPYDIEAAYSCSYQKGDVREGDVATLSLSHLDGITVEQVEVYLKSNKSSGGGAFTVTANEETVAAKSGMFNEWFGAFDNSEYHGLSLLERSVESVQSLNISLTGTANSLHIEKYVITYGNAPARTVTLMNGKDEFATLREETGGQGVVLPSAPDVTDWWFKGWCRREFWTESSLPELYHSYNRFYPSEDCTLWAVYEYIADNEQVYATELQDGDYRYVNSQNNQALTGVPDEDGYMDKATLNEQDDQQIYSIRFVGQDTAFITHAESDVPIGYNAYEPKMEDKASPWLVYHVEEQVMFWAEINGKSYVFLTNTMDKYGNICAGLFHADPGESPMRLMPVREEKEALYTCHPEMKVGIEEVMDEGMSGLKDERRVVFGIYEISIRNGKKYLILR